MVEERTGGGQQGVAEAGRSVEDALLGCFNDVKHVVAVMSGKGGVGKSTVTGLLAMSLRSLGYSVAILDADITGPSVPRAFGLRGQPGVTPYGLQPAETATGIRVMSINLMLPQEDDPVVWRGPLLAGAVKQFWGETDWREVDFMLVDLPPGTGDVPLTVLQSLPVSRVVIVTSPQQLASMVVKKSVKMTQKIGTRVLGLIENMSSVQCPHCGTEMEIFGPSLGRETAAAMGIAWLGSLPWNPDLLRRIDQGRIEEIDPNPLAGIARRLAGELMATAGT
ncbi:MAG: Mrp/NBP35 family ATP-binding protein [Syntrophomonadaceae bacterium]|jgi:Mrp family chromosome partitioning ATPase|nr:Mrp/NBP35 family ATP-binding protein [Syntrophomonadaceae bacterium]MDH7497560.1 Mrp/NBP35 family ATP-binding protein [Syntrophomonadaceae bacterium]